ncbi:pyridoxamine 5'-phosphate oxidase family protein [Geodermatophilus sp. SYSU D00779]
MPTCDSDGTLVPLDDVECRALLLGGRIGRLAFTRNALPAIQPVSYRVHDGEVVIPAVPDSRFVPRSWGAVVALGVDSYDDATRTGWSVTVVGPSRSVVDPAEVAALDALPWSPAGTRCGRCYVAVRIGMLSGWRTESRAP